MFYVSVTSSISSSGASLARKLSFPSWVESDINSFLFSLRLTLTAELIRRSGVRVRILMRNL
jgi:hypothetical protein